MCVGDAVGEELARIGVVGGAGKEGEGERGRGAETLTEGR